MLTFAFRATGGCINRECLGYFNQATKSIRESMYSPESAASVAVVGAILLLAGVEFCNSLQLGRLKTFSYFVLHDADLINILARLGMWSQVQLHMEAIRQLLDICRMKHIYLHDAINRAIFWSNITSCL